jgi:hypothetical protein
LGHLRIAGGLLLQIATGGETEELETDHAKSAATELGARGGGEAHAAKLTPEQRAQIARKAAKARWQD